MADKEYQEYIKNLKEFMREWVVRDIYPNSYEIDDDGNYVKTNKRYKY